MTEELQLGLYQNYRGNYYRALHIARHTVTKETYVVYQALYDDPEVGNCAIWTRPIERFTGTLEYEGKIVPPMSKVTEDDSANTSRGQ